MSRTKGREYALQILYQADSTDIGPLEAMESFWENFSAEEEIRTFTEDLVRGVTEHLADLDELIEKTSINWRLDRMPRVDRNVLRIAVYELRFAPDIPVPVVINEAIEIGKRFGSEDSGAFINGILDRVAQELERE